MFLEPFLTRRSADCQEQRQTAGTESKQLLVSSISLIPLPSYAIGSDKVLHRLFQRCQLQRSGNAPLPKAPKLSYRGLPGGSELKMMSSASFLEPLSTPATAYQHPPSLHSAFTWFFGQMERQNRSSPYRPSGCSEVGGAGALLQLPRG